MEKRLLLAVVLMTAAIMVTNILFPPPEPAAPGTEGAPAVAEAPPGEMAPAPAVPTAPAAMAADTTSIVSDLYRYVFSDRGAAIVRATLPRYPSYSQEGEPVQLIPEGVADFLSYRIVIGGDTLDLRALPYEMVREDGASGDALRFAYRSPEGFAVTLRYEFDRSNYLFRVSGSVEGLGGRTATLLTELGPGLEMHEHPDHRSERELAAVTRSPDGVDRIALRRVDVPRTIAGPLAWAGIKDKYFLAAVIAGSETPLAEATIVPEGEDTVTVGGRDVEVPLARVIAALPIAATGDFSFQAYLGPQDYDLLAAIGYDLEEVTPYGYRWLQPVIRPLAAAVLWVLNTLHDVLGIAYGWVLVIFGVMMRILMWPLNARAMRAQMKNMALQPLLQEIRDKYRNDPQKQQEAMVAFYREHKFNPFGGCLPLLVPFPVLITLFFVFQNTIAFRGAEFLWLPDLSLRDPFYILPAILVVSMFALQWVSVHLSGMEQNPQMKMMMYFMPIMMGVIFFMLPSGLNLYYAVQQVASVPQQVLIARERRKAQEEMKAAGKTRLQPPAGGKRKSRSKR